MIKKNHRKFLGWILPALMLSAIVLVFSCNNKASEEKTSTDSVTEKKDTLVMDNSMMGDSTDMDTTKPKGEQVPPPK